jgi:poly-gamma-glutamate capsule biosynthesis protein CapA/YwtB (metallophosphatase superfamily)
LYDFSTTYDLSSATVAEVGLTKTFHFRAHPRAIEFLKVAKIDCVTLANNHTLDYGVEALEECLLLLDQAGIQHTGVGRNLAEALRLADLETSDGRVAVISLTDNEPDWEASQESPGLHFIRYDGRGLLNLIDHDWKRVFVRRGGKQSSSLSAPTWVQTGENPL